MRLTAARPAKLRRATRGRVGALFGLGLALAGLALHRSGRDAARPPAPAAPDAPERLSLLVADEDMRRLARWREQALAASTLYATDNEFVPATLEHRGARVAVKLRLKGGGAPSHLSGDRWSFRVKVEHGATAMGLENFALMDPQRRGFALEWLARALARREGIIAKRYELVDVWLNGKRKGIHAVDEHYTDAMLQANARRPGPVLRVQQESLWSEGAAFTLLEPQRDDYYLATEIDAIDGEAATGERAAQLDAGRRVYEAFRAGRLPADDVFDPSFATWLALGDLLGAWHGFGTWNSKFYVDPLTQRLEPVPDDSYNEDQADPGSSWFRYTDPVVRGRHLKLAFRDLRFTRRYLAELRRVVAPGYLEDALRAVDADLARAVRTIRLDDPTYVFPAEQLLANRARLRAVLDPPAAAVAHVARHDAASGRLTLAVAATAVVPIEVQGVEGAAGRRWTPSSEVLLPGRPTGRLTVLPSVLQEVSFDGPAGALSADLALRHRVLGAEDWRTLPVRPWPGFQPTDLAADLDAESDPAAFPWLQVDARRGVARVSAGAWRLDRPLVLPGGLVLEVGPGTRLDLVAGAAIVCRRPVRLLGTAAAPVVLSSSDGTGRGLVVLGEGSGVSWLEHVEVAGMRGASALTFHRGQVVLRRARVQGSRGLTIVRGGLEASELVLEELEGDALRLVYATATLRDASIHGATGAGLSCRGGLLDLARVTVTRSGVGLAADDAVVRATALRVDGAAVGVESRDQSQVTLMGAEVVGCAVGLAVHRDAPGYGPGRLDASKVTLSGVTTRWRVEVGAELGFDGQRVAGAEAEVVLPGR